MEYRPSVAEAGMRIRNRSPDLACSHSVLSSSMFCFALFAIAGHLNVAYRTKHRNRESIPGAARGNRTTFKLTHYREFPARFIIWLEGKVGSATFRATSTPATGRIEESKKPSCTSTEA